MDIEQLKQNYSHAFDCVKAKAMDDIFAEGFCRPHSAFVQIVEAIPQATDDESRRLREALFSGEKQLDVLTEQFRQFEDLIALDATSLQRWKAISSTALAAISTGSERRESLCEAVEAFEITNQVFQVSKPIDAWKPDHEFFCEIGADLPGPWTAAKWMVGDIITQIQQAGMPPSKAQPARNVPRPKDPTPRRCTSERTWLLSGGETGEQGEGEAFQLVVEAVPGPPGLVVPDWWKLGLLPFVTAKKAEQFVNAVQQSMERMRHEHLDLGVTLRWHLRPAHGSIGWWYGIKGRSGMAAAAVVAQAVFQRIVENRSEDDKESLLDQESAVTAVLDFPTDTGEVWNCRLTTVNDGSLFAKFKAARKRGVNVSQVFIAPKQEVPNNQLPVGLLPPIPVETLHKLFERMSSLEKVLDNYRDARRLHFEYRPREEPKTPGDAS